MIREALTLYQTTLRKPSFTIYCLDFSGSMAGNGESQVKSAMRALLDQQQASQYFLQATPRDVSVVIRFNDGLYPDLRVAGNDPTKLSAFERDRPDSLVEGPMYQAAIHGLEIIRTESNEDYFPAIILMTDGKSDDHASELQNYINQYGMTDVPIFSIEFGSADPSQLNKVATLTSGQVFNGKDDLISAFRIAKGYN